MKEALHEQRLRTAQRRASGLDDALGEMCGMHRNYIGAIERAERTLSIVSADKLARALGTTLSGMFSELERRPGGHDEE